MVETALIGGLSLPGEIIFRRTVLERLLILCDRIGIGRFIIEAPDALRASIEQSLGTFRADPRVHLVKSLQQARDLLSAQSDVLLMLGNSILFKSHLTSLLTAWRNDAHRQSAVINPAPGGAGLIAVGPLDDLLQARLSGKFAALSTEQPLPFALAKPGDRAEVERRLGMAVRIESAERDAPMARAIDRKVSWRLSYRLARTAITPNQITIANSLLGGLCAGLFSIPRFAPRAAAGLLFVAITTLDGVDGEVARLKLCETDFGAQLDVITDTIVNLLVFVGIFIGCYRVSYNPIYPRLLALMIGGYGLCGLAYYWAVRAAGEESARWSAMIDRSTSRDFSYLLLIFALANRLQWFAWGIAFGTYVFALVLVAAVMIKRPARQLQDGAGARPSG
jgi:phosphatidylglycerophosphate synthase